MSRFNETEEADRQGIFHVLGMSLNIRNKAILNLISFRHIREHSRIESTNGRTVGIED